MRVMVNRDSQITIEILQLVGSDLKSANGLSYDSCPRGCTALHNEIRITKSKHVRTSTDISIATSGGSGPQHCISLDPAKRTSFQLDRP